MKGNLFQSATMVALLSVLSLAEASSAQQGIAAAERDPAGLLGADYLLTLERKATEIRFTLGATLHRVEGTAALDSGEIRVDPETGELSGKLVIDALSAHTGNEKRDREMHRKVLESDRFGRFVLEPRRLVGELSPEGTARVEIHADLTIHGGTHPVVLPAEISIEGDRLSASATLEVPYVAWGMKDPSKLFLRVGKVVRVQIAATGRLAAAGKRNPADTPRKPEV